MNAPTPSPATTVMLPVGSLRPNPWNRKKYDEAKFKDLVASVRNIGLLQAIVARPIEGAGAGQPTHEIVAGERRWRACQEAGFAEIPATVRTLTDLELIEALLVENTEREEMNALDEATCLQALVRKPGQLQGYESVDDMAMHIGRSRAYCYQRIKLLTLCPEVQTALREGQISANHALRMARLASAADQAEALKACVEGWGGNAMSVRDLDAYIHRTFMLDLARAPFNIKSETLLPTAGSCTSCPKRSGNTPELFEDVKKGDTCTDGACYAAKETAHRAALIAKAEAEGKKVITGAAAKKAMPHEYSRDIKGLLKLDAVHYELDSSKPLRKLLGKHPLEVLVFEDPHTKDLHDVVREDDAVALLKERGVLKKGRMPTTSASQREADAKAKAEKAWRTAAAEAVVAAAAGEMKADLRGRMVWFIAMLVWRELAHDTKERVTKLMGWPPLPANWESGTGKTVNDHFDALTASQLQQYFVACMVSADLAINSYTPAGKPNRINTWARDLGVDLEAIKAQLRAATAKRVESPAKAAKKAAAKGQPAVTPETALAAELKEYQAAEKKHGRTTLAAGASIKYRDPMTGSTWSGRGLQPRWLKVAIEGGKKLSDFDIAKPVPKSHISDAAADVFNQAAA